MFLLQNTGTNPGIPGFLQNIISINPLEGSALRNCGAKIKKNRNRETLQHLFAGRTMRCIQTAGRVADGKTAPHSYFYAIFAPHTFFNRLTMNNDSLRAILAQLHFDGEIRTDLLSRRLYATDGSAYKEMPLAVAIPKSTSDLKKLIGFAREHRTSLIARTAGTSLAGQVTGTGIVVDFSKYFNQIIELNADEKWVRVQPGVVLDELNLFLRPHGLFFGPETSTANRCMLGGMLGNNACGLHSLVYGSTREHTLSVKTLLSDGSEVEFGPVDHATFEQKMQGETLENALYRQVFSMLSDAKNQQLITENYPDPEVPRRNTGYAIDLLLNTEPFGRSETPFNFSKLLAGSEGTLCLTTEIRLNLVPLPPKEKALLVVHFDRLNDAFEANLIALKHSPTAVEMMDKTILDCTKGNIEQTKNRFFVQGEPESLLIIEFARETKSEIETEAASLTQELKDAGMGYHFPLIWGDDIKKVWNLRKAGLGVLSNIPGDAKPVSVTEDTSVKPALLPSYMADFQKLMSDFGLECVYHAHIGTGELHLRPVLDLKSTRDVELFRKVAHETALLVKKYRGSLSGEHGDGRLRGEFIPLMYGQEVYQLLKSIKKTWDPENIFNPGKITDTPPMDTALRFVPGEPVPEFDTVFDYSDSLGFMRAIERCNGSGDCRKSAIMGGTMCPSYMATRDEKHVTRGRANILREVLTDQKTAKGFGSKEIYEALDLCLSCKACKAECPSGVDMAKLKAEFLQHYYDIHGIPLRSRLVAWLPRLNRLAAAMPRISNFFLRQQKLWTLTGFTKHRTLPLFAPNTLQKAMNAPFTSVNTKTVYFFNDEFTNFNDVQAGMKAIMLLERLGYKIVIPKHRESGRTFLSKGLIRSAKKVAEENVLLLKDLVTPDCPLIGIEPSALLSFRDEYPELVSPHLREQARELGKNTLLIDEFIVREFNAGRISPERFTTQKKEILFHGHCQQKAIASTATTIRMLSIPANYTAKEIPSGCCGMAGSFGYEKEHYEVSMKIGELVLFPTVRKAPETTTISAIGTSCRHQIKDGTGRTSLHPIEILFDAMI